MRKILLLLLVPFLSIAQQSELWRLEVPSLGGKIPFHVLMEGSSPELSAFALNADEKLQFDRVYEQGDTLYLSMDLYDLELVLIPQGNKTTGYMSKRGSDLLYRQVPIEGTKGDKERFKNAEKISSSSLSNKYEITFISTTTGNESPAIGVFENTNDGVRGTFLASTGDYRYFQGNVIGDSLFLSALGLNPYLYKARIKGDSLVGGEAFSPFAKFSLFSGKKNDQVALPDASKLTFLKEGYDKFDFTFSDIHGTPISLSDSKYKGKVTVVQILGTWCPNCLDETKFLMEYKKTNPDFEIIGLSFERSTEPDFAYPKIMKFIQRFGVDYPVLLAGTIQQAAEKLPQLNHVMAFPTSIIVDKKGVVRNIHTGFSGPSTGKYYEDYVKEFTALMEQLQAE